MRLDIAQDDLNLILGGNAARVYGLKLPHTRLFRPVSGEPMPRTTDSDSLPPKCG
jgi:hypothetical protein